MRTSLSSLVVLSSLSVAFVGCSRSNDPSHPAPSINSYLDAKGNRIELTTQEPVNANLIWSQLDLQEDKVPGTSTARAFRDLNLQAPQKSIVVAVLDSGVDVQHEDLAGMIWTNEAEANGKPGVDDDGNGFVDDVHGWNFIGNKNGQNLGASNLEFARLVGKYRREAKVRTLTAEELKLQAEVEARYAEELGNAKQELAQAEERRSNYLSAMNRLFEAGLTVEDGDEVSSLAPKTEEVKDAKELVLGEMKTGANAAIMLELVERKKLYVDRYLDIDFDPSSVIGDNPNDLHEKDYGNANVFVDADLASHGTHCSGIIGALRGNGKGADGQSNFVKIMPIRAVPDGDERDKDIANGIRYAVDNGAKIVSMSFGKQFSPDKTVVDEAVAYAEAHGVLLVHAAGNDAHDNDTGNNFPTAKALSGMKASNWLEVGSSTRYADNRLPSYFSNFGQTVVDLFAPGGDIYSSIPGNQYAVYSGTSMAAPQVAGIAGLVLSQRPNLTAAELRNALTANVTKLNNLEVRLPDETGKVVKVKFGTLSVTGGVVNAFDALSSVL